MTKARTRIGGTMGGADEQTMAFVQNIADMHEEQPQNSNLAQSEASVKCTPRVHYSISSINDFIEKLRLISLTKRALSSNEPNTTGFQDLFKDFYDELKAIFKQRLPDYNDHKLNNMIKRVGNYVMRRLHQTVWHPDRLKNSDDCEYSQKVEKLLWLTPEYLELPEAEETVNWPMWGVCIEEIQ